MNLTEKISIVTGVGWMQGNCVGNIGKVESIGFPGLCLQDAPTGVRFAEGISAFPSSM
jgi:beta-glucosidase